MTSCVIANTCPPFKYVRLGWAGNEADRAKGDLIERKTVWARQQVRYEARQKPAAKKRKIEESNAAAKSSR
jgi:hypothetical protein